jgi:nicotinamidase-related amidase
MSALSHRIIGNKLNPTKTVLLVCDVQERFRSLIWRMETVVQTTQYMTRLATLLEIPVVVTEQYKKAFGSTISDCWEQDEMPFTVFEKKQFSMCTPPVLEQLRQYPERDTFILVGIEAHVCVQQTCLDLLSLKRHVHLIADGISSQQPYDRDMALQRMQQAGAFVTTAQSAAFMWMQTADHPQFKAFRQLTMEHMKKRNEFNDDYQKNSVTKE